jgi:hypothetical protein
MAASLSITGFGSVFSYESSPGVYTPLVEVISISGGDVERDIVDVTHMASDDSHREKIGAIFNVQPYSIVLNYVKTTATLLETLVAAGRKNFKITYPGGSTRSFAGIPSALNYGDAQIDDKLTMTLTIEPSGKSVFVA